MTDVTVGEQPARTGPLDASEMGSFALAGFLRVGRLLDADGVGAARGALAEARELESSQGREYDLLDAKLWPEDKAAADLEPGKSVGFLFNLWLQMPAFRDIAFSPDLARWSAQLIGAAQVRVFEDNALYKEAHKGGELKWHQDYSYWPLAQPNAVTAWIALDDVTLENGAVRFGVGSRLLGERLPANFGTGNPYLRDRRAPCVREMSDPSQEGLTVETMELKAGEVSFHHSMTWHASGPNTTSLPRRAYAIRYGRDGPRWP